jgi:acetyltransferase-like isoleucine patch superfamily enzyme
MIDTILVMLGILLATTIIGIPIVIIAFILKNNVFIGAGAIIIQGITIGENSIIGAGSVVIKNIPENSTYVGNPAKLIKS